MLDALNVLIRGNAARADGVVDPAAFFTDPTDLTYFSTDGVHLNATGWETWADLTMPFLPFELPSP